MRNTKGDLKVTRKDYAKAINWKGIASREIQVDDLPEYEIGQILNPGLCWTDGGEFKAENKREYCVIFEIVEPVEGHAIDYDDEDECYSLGCEDCCREKEILIDRDFEVVDFWGYDKETGTARVFVKPVEK